MKVSVIAALLLSLSACSHPSSIPPQILSPQQMRAVMYDALRADEIADFYSNRDSTYRKSFKKDSLYQTIFVLHKTSRTQFRNSLKFYQAHPDLLRDIIDSMQKQNIADTNYKQKIPDTIRKKITPRP